MKAKIESVMVWDLLDEIRVTYKSGTKRWVDVLSQPKTVRDFLACSRYIDRGSGVGEYRMEE